LNEARGLVCFEMSLCYVICQESLLKLSKSFEINVALLLRPAKKYWRLNLLCEKNQSFEFKNLLYMPPICVFSTQD